MNETIEQLKDLLLEGGVERLILDKCYPIGSYWISSNSANPSTIIGGTWSQVKDKFILAAGDTYSGGDTGGNSTHSHRYGYQVANYYGVVGYLQAADVGALQGGTTPVGFQLDTTAETRTATINGSTTDSTVDKVAYRYKSVTDTSTSSNLPPYEVAYVFKRTA